MSSSDNRSNRLAYMPGFGNDFETESLPGALPPGRNSPQRCNYGLYAEQLSGSPFTAPREQMKGPGCTVFDPVFAIPAGFRKLSCRIGKRHRILSTMASRWDNYAGLPLPCLRSRPLSSMESTP